MSMVVLDCCVFKVEYSSLEKVQKELEAVLCCSHLICCKNGKKVPYTNDVIHKIQQ